MLRQVLIALSRNGTARRFVTRSRVARRGVRRFVAGETLDDALRVAAELNARGFDVSLDLLGEATLVEADARRAGAAYEGILPAIHSRGLRSHVSVKLSQLGLDLSRDLAAEMLRSVAARAHAVATFVRVDMEDSGRLPAILQVFDRVWDGGARNIGIALQAYLYRTPEDVDRYAARGVGIRLCKGAYAEPPQVAHPHKADVDRAFARLTERLLRAGSSAAIATHDERLIAHAKAVARGRGLALDRFEFQFLYGIRRDLQESLVREGYRVRVYVPFGTHWYPYFMRRLAERPANLVFLARHLIRP